jgi:hypothetical protein
VAAGEWPEPALLKKIVDAGDAAVGPLISIVRTYPRGWPAEATLDHAATLLTVLRSPEAIPELIEIIRRYDEETGDTAARLLGSFGTIAFEPTLAFCSDAAVTGYPRAHAIAAAIGSAGDDSLLRARLGDVVRPMLANAIELLRQASKEVDPDESDELDDNSAEYDVAWFLEGLDDEIEADEPEGEWKAVAKRGDISIVDAPQSDGRIDGASQNLRKERAERKRDLYRDVLFLVTDLATLADPGARDLIKTAFAENMVETFFFDEATVENLYKQGGEPARTFPDWLESYRDSYRKHIKRTKRAPRPLSEQALPGERESEQAASLPAHTVRTPVRNVGPQLGRNEPCWCGSGKKYKRCHLGKDNRI